MIALWLCYATAVGLLAGVAAALAERLLRLWRLPVRGAWAAAVVVTLLAPAVVLLRPPPAAPAAAVVAGDAIAVGLLETPLMVEPTLAERVATAYHATLAAVGAAAARLAPLDAPLLAAWALLSLLLLAVLGRSVRELRRRRRGWRPQVVDGHEVLVAPDTGPAVVGGGPVRVVLPAWALELDGSLRRLVLLHETEHLRARDPHLLLAAVVALVAAPWNLALWWQVGRLRLAVELDCDRRVLRAHGDVERYGLLLMAVGQRTGGLLRLATPALAENPTALERRITAMTDRPPRRRLLRALLLATLGAAAGAAACVVPSPNVVAGPDGAASAVAAAPAPQLVDPSAAFFEFQVEQPVVALNNVAPVYPSMLQAQGTSGQVIAQFVVDTAGQVEVGTFKAIESTHELFTAAVRSAVGRMRFAPAEIGGRKVRQLVQQPFVFNIGVPLRADSSAGPLLPARARVMVPLRASEVGGRADTPAPGTLQPTRAPGASATRTGEPTAAPYQPALQPSRRAAPQLPPPPPLLADAPPVYPAALRAQGIEGEVVVQFVVDSAGRVDVGSLKVLDSDHELFTAAVRAALPRIRYEPPRVGGRAVRQLVQRAFVFDIGG